MKQYQAFELNGEVSHDVAMQMPILETKEQKDFLNHRWCRVKRT